MYLTLNICQSLTLGATDTTSDAAETSTLSGTSVDVTDTTDSSSVSGNRSIYVM